MFCRQCGHKLMENAAFCNQCGTRVPQLAVVAPVEPIEPELPAEVIAPVEAPAEEAIVVEAVAETPVEEATAEVAEQTPVEEPTAEEPAAEESSEEVSSEEAVPEEEAVREAPAVPPVEPSVYKPVQTAAPAQAQTQKPKKIKKLPNLGVRIIMQILSFFLCLLLLVSMIATVAVSDLRTITSGDGIKRVLDAVLFGKTAEHVVPQRPNDFQAITVADQEFEFNIEDIPMDILAGGATEENMEALVEWMYQELEKSAEGELTFTQEELGNFVEESTVTDFLTEKMAGFAEDVINGTEKTEITTDEIMDLLEENEKHLKQELNVELSKEDKKELKSQLQQIVEKEDLSNTIRETVTTTVEETLNNSVGMDLNKIRGILQLITSDLVLVIAIAACLLLLGLLLLTNYYNLGAGLTWAASAGIVAGLILALPLLILNHATDWLTGMIPSLTSILALLRSFTASMVPLHYGLLIGSFVLLVCSIVLRIVTRGRRQRKYAEAVA